MTTPFTAPIVPDALALSFVDPAATRARIAHLKRVLGGTPGQEGQAWQRHLDRTRTKPQIASK